MATIKGLKIPRAPSVRMPRGPTPKLPTMSGLLPHLPVPGVRFVFNPIVLSKIPGMSSTQQGLRGAAKQIEQEAKRIAPVDTGAYHGSIKVDLQQGVRLVADVDHAGFVEFGTDDTPVFAVFRRAAEAAGYQASARRGG